MESLSSKKRVLSDSDESESNSVKPKRIRDDLLDILQDSDVSTASSDLDSFIKRFEDEISEPTESIADRESSSGESRPDIGFLFEASDDELGLPPTDLTPVESEKTGVSVELGEVWWLDNQISGYDLFEYEFGYTGEDAVIGSFDDIEYVELDGLFNYTDLGFGLPELPSQPETMPAQ
ncbi:hypothetical protein L2E82_13627 [Cichorium intybus]|uniref:Uncharacterized protein n=1 Tax=Cichorium intybus TaxID=13427 RepID=A0ACB9EXT4_CICIN|nr:hypothetical protein L2E82_13627 [Cichorium intybus]